MVERGAQHTCTYRQAVRLIFISDTERARLLWAYLQKHPQLKASYLVSGETANERIFRVVPASQLEGATLPMLVAPVLTSS